MVWLFLTGLTKLYKALCALGLSYFSPHIPATFNFIPVHIQCAFFIICLTIFLSLIEDLRSCPPTWVRYQYIKAIMTLTGIWVVTTLFAIWRSQDFYRAGLWWRIVEFNVAPTLRSFEEVLAVAELARSGGYGCAFLDKNLTAYVHTGAANILWNPQGIVEHAFTSVFEAEDLFFFTDWVSFWLVLLVVLSIFVCALSSYERADRLRYFGIALNWIGFWMVIAFTTTNLLVFYCAFEAVLIPTFFLIGAFGSSASRVPAAMRLFLFTVVGSIFFLVALVYLYAAAGTYNYWELVSFCAANTDVQIILFPLIFFGLAFKIPFFPVYLWLTSAHVEAPTAGSMILASLMLKLGVYGLLRFAFQICPLGVEFWNTLSVVLPILGFTFISYLTYVINDLKRIVAYTSISHMNFLVVALVSTGSLGFGAAVYTMISHAIISSALFFLIGCLYRRGESRSVLLFSGLAQTAPRLFFFLSLFLFANAGLPLFAGFPGEVLALLSLWHYSPMLVWLVLPGFFFMVFGMVRVIAMGCGTAVLPKGRASYLIDLTSIEVALLVFLMVWQLTLAFFPYIVINSIFVL